MSDGGKGSRPRPFSVTQDEYNRRWDMIFGRDLDDQTDIKESGNGKETKEVSTNHTNSPNAG
jgi:hypothetical protein